MKLMSELMSWIHEMQSKNAGSKKFTLPMSIEEIDEVTKSNYIHSMQIPISNNSIASLYGADIEQDYFAKQIRQKRLEVPLSHYVTEVSLAESLIHNTSVNKMKQLAYYEYKLLFSSVILTDLTALKIKFEWDIFVGLKRLLHLTKWFPIKQKEAIIDCKILYPYCKVALPFNKHTFKAVVK